MKFWEEDRLTVARVHRQNLELRVFHIVKISAIFCGSLLIGLALVNLAFRFRGSHFSVIRPNVDQESAEYLLSALLQAEATVLALIVTVGLGQTILAAERRRLWAQISDRQDRSTGLFVMSVLISGIVADSLGLLDVASGCEPDVGCNAQVETLVGHASLLGVGAILAIVALIFSQIEASSVYLRARLSNKLLKGIAAESSPLEQRDAAELATTLVDEALARQDPYSAAALLLVLFDGMNETSIVAGAVLLGIKGIAGSHNPSVLRQVVAMISRSDVSDTLKMKIGAALAVVP